MKIETKERQAGPLPQGTRVRWLDRWKVPMLGKIIRFDRETNRYEIKTGKTSKTWVMWWMVEKI